MGSQASEQSTFVQQFIRYLRPLVHAFLDGSRNGLPRLAAQAPLFVHQDCNAAQAAHLVRALGDGQANAQLLLHALLHPVQVGQAAQVLQPLQHLLFFAAREHQDAHIAAWCLE